MDLRLIKVLSEKIVDFKRNYLTFLDGMKLGKARGTFASSLGGEAAGLMVASAVGASTVVGAYTIGTFLVNC